MISDEKRRLIVTMHSHGHSVGEVAAGLSVSVNTVKLWIGRHKAGEGLASRPYPKLTAPPVGTTEAGCVVAAFNGWFTPAEAKAATGVADNTALLKVMREAGAIEKQGLGPATQYRSLMTEREWLDERGIMQGAYPFKDRWPVSCDFKCHKDREPPSNAPGVDYAAPTMTPVLAVAAGKIVGLRWRDAGGRSFWIDHGDRWMSYYAHNKAVAALTGERVEQGQVVSYVGSTGHSTGPHLHLSLRRSTVWIDPDLVLN